MTKLRLMNHLKTSILLLFFFSVFTYSMAQNGFLKADGIKIVDARGENVVLRGAGLGGWMLQEGYMMQTSGFAGAQYQIKQTITNLIGKEGMETFYDAWLANYCTKADVDSMAAWGFNSIRLPMHYNLFTLPIEDEPVAGQDTWLDRGFEMVDNLLEWCTSNEMYLILDLHAAPGGQGKDAHISDYNPSKPSLWESSENKRKTVALWQKLAGRYASEPWMGGYDLINEPNWDFENSGNQNGCSCNQNKPLWDLYQDIIKAIREVDQNHIIIIEGNCWGNNYNGLPKINNWDNNLVMSFHKYWSYNDQASINGILNHRASQNVPIWLGESGENSNTWFANAINLVESNNIGWAWWPYKKIGSVTGNVTAIKTDSYQRLLNYWGGSGSKPSVTDATKWLMEQAEMLKIENCTINYDVNDAMFRQAHGDKSPIPFKQHTIPGTIFATDYDLGANNYAYFDADTSDFHVSTDEYTAWNQGYSYRNDGVDIEACTDNTSNGFNVGWTQQGEWLLYTVGVDSTAAYTIDFRYAANGSSGKFILQLNGQPITPVQALPSTGGWSTWQTHTIENVVLEKGTHQLKLHIDNSGFNINYLKFHSMLELGAITPEIIHLKTDATGEFIEMISNVGYDTSATLQISDFAVTVNGKVREIVSVGFDAERLNVLLVKLDEGVIRANTVRLSMNNKQLASLFGDFYPTFSNRTVQNEAPVYVILPAKIEAEDFNFNNGLVLENCTDTGGGQNLGYTNPGDYVDYQVYLEEAADLIIHYRVASLNNGRFETRLIHNDTQTALHSINVSTGGWQTWKTVSVNASFPAGKSVLRVYVLSGEFNFNWLSADSKTEVNIQKFQSSNIVISHLPGDNRMMVFNHSSDITSCKVECFNLNGRKIFTEKISLQGHSSQLLLNTLDQKGIFIFQIVADHQQNMQKLMVR